MYETLGGKPVIPAADLLDHQSAANLPGDTRVPYASVGKRPGMLAFRDDGGDLSLVFATGALSSDAWRASDGSANYVAPNLGSWTVGVDSTYAAGLLTTDGGDDAAGRVTQTVTALTAGKYRVFGTYAAEGEKGVAPDFSQPRLQVTGSEDGALLSKNLNTVIHATAAESADPKGDFDYTFTLTETQNVVITLDIVDEDGALQAGSSFIELNPIHTA